MMLLPRIFLAADGDADSEERGTEEIVATHSQLPDGGRGI